MEEELIYYKNVGIHRDEIEVLNHVDFTLKKGQFIYLIGKVGSGKTSLMKTFYSEVELAGDEAKVLGYNLLNIKRKSVSQLRRRIGIVFQDFKLLTDRSVYENLEFVLKATGWKNKNEIKERVNETLELVGMGKKGYKWPNELSGGEQQRIVIARAVLNSPDIILADEPTGNLDVETGHKIVELLHSICKSGTAVIMTTHNLHLLHQYPGLVYRCGSRLFSNVTDEFLSHDSNNSPIDQIKEEIDDEVFTEECVI